MLLGIQVFKMHNGTVSCKKRPRTRDCNDQIRGLKTCRDEAAENSCEKIQQQPIARIFIDKRLIPPKVARLKSVKPGGQEKSVQATEPVDGHAAADQCPAQASFPCLLCGVGFRSADRFDAHGCTACHVNRVGETGRRYEEAFGKKQGGDGNSPHTDDEPATWKALVNYCNMKGKQLDFHMRGGFTGSRKDVFLFEIDVCLDGTPFSGVGVSLNEAKRDVASRALDALANAVPQGDCRSAQELALCETDASIMCLRRDLCVVLEQIATHYDVRAREQFGLQVLDALCQIANDSDLLVGAMPVGSAFKGLFLPNNRDISFTLEMLVFCARWPTDNLASRVLHDLQGRLPDVLFRSPQLDESQAATSGNGHSCRVDVHFVASKRRRHDGQLVFDDADEPCEGSEDGGRPLPKGSCLHAQDLLTAARRFKRRIAINQSAVAVFRILVHLCHIHHLLTTEATANDKGRISETHLESLIDYWLLVKADASMEWLFCRALHSLAYDGTMMASASQTHPITQSGCVDEKNVDDVPLSVQALARRCIQLVVERRLIEAFSADAMSMLSLTNPA